MESTDQQYQGTSQDTEPSPTSTISRLPDELLLEVFDSYRQSIDQYDNLWRKKYAWLDLAHVCRRWRAVVFASSYRLDINIIVGPEKPGQIKTVLSGHLPILIDYSRSYGPLVDITGNALWRIRAALRHRDRVRGISINGFLIGKFIRETILETNRYFPALESLDLDLCFPRDEPDIPATFLSGPDQSDLPLRRLKLTSVFFASVFGLLSSATALTDLTLDVSSSVAGFDPCLLVCLQDMQCLRSLDLSTTYHRDSQSQRSTPKDIVPLQKLTRFHYSGATIFLSNLMSGLSAPSLQDARFVLCIRSPLLYLSRVIDDVREELRSASVTFDKQHFCLSSSPHSGEIDSDHFKPSFRFNLTSFPDSTHSINITPSMKLAMTEELALIFPSSNIVERVNVFSLRDFLRQFRSVRVLRVGANPFMRKVGLYLNQAVGEAILPVLEEIELSIPRLTGYSDKEYQRRVAEALAAFEPFVSSCERAGRLVKVYHCER